ncbi:hypothetical protein ACEWY4_010085 [Coilia grayii]|uniref:Uncharacterized protein n=1 Tax=Coilia grayii TaxID=363190 RepID=A0ABD1K8B5_9TELE
MGSVQLQNPAHPATLLAKANQMRLSGMLCDVAIVVDGREFRAHRTILACASKMFQILFQRQSQRYTLDFLSPKTFGQILDYAYTSTLHARLEELDDLLYAAEILEMEFLEEQCLKILESVQSAEEAQEEEERRRGRGRRGEEEEERRRRGGGEEREEERRREKEEEDRRGGRRAMLGALGVSAMTETSQNPLVPTSLRGSTPNSYVNQSLSRGVGHSTEFTEGLNMSHLPSNQHPITPQHVKREEPMQVDTGGSVHGSHDDDEGVTHGDRAGTPSRASRESVITRARQIGHAPEDPTESQSGFVGVASLYSMPPVTASHIAPLAVAPPLHMQLDLGPYGGLLGPNFLQRDFLSTLVGVANDRRHLFRCDVCGMELPDDNALEQHRCVCVCVHV